jgi:hypothetical protein
MLTPITSAFISLFRHYAFHPFSPCLLLLAAIIFDADYCRGCRLRHYFSSYASAIFIMPPFSLSRFHFFDIFAPLRRFSLMRFFDIAFLRAFH